MQKDIYNNRKFTIATIVLIVALIYSIKLFSLQVLDDSYKAQANSNAIKELTIYPNRGLIYDRKGSLIVYNEPVYDIYVIPRQTRPFDSTLFCSLIEIDQEELRRKLKKAREYSRYKESVVFKQIPLTNYSKFQEHLYEFPGFYGLVRTIRRYPFRSAAHILGDIGEVDSTQIRISKNYYKPGDYVGKSGVEKSYESKLRGKRGLKYVFVDVLDRVQGSFKDGAMDTLPASGSDLVSTIDIQLQNYAEELMKDKIGSIVAIEPSTGEILAMVSSPTFDPNLLTGSIRGHNYKILQRDSLSPLFNRPIMGQYPPGSTFKVLVALIGLQEEAIHPNFSYNCNGLYFIPGYTLHCSHNHAFPYNVSQAIRHSCNPYFWQTFRNTIDNPRYNNAEESFQEWYNYLIDCGIGKKLNIDLPGELKGNAPSPAYYNKLYGSKRWGSTTILSLGIGQGELLVTPLQLANLYTLIANRGKYIQPHLVKGVLNDSFQIEPIKFETINTTLEDEVFDYVIDGLEKVVEEGTARMSRMDNIIMCGKTGTAQNPHGEDHSIFGAFAPKLDPQIAVAVIIENGGGGSRYAAPISSLIIEKYLTDSISHKREWLEQRILEANLLNTD